MAPAGEELLANQPPTVTKVAREPRRGRTGTNRRRTGTGREGAFPQPWWATAARIGFLCVGKGEETVVGCWEGQNGQTVKRSNGARSERGRNRGRESRPRQIWRVTEKYLAGILIQSFTGDCAAGGLGTDSGTVEGQSNLYRLQWFSGCICRVETPKGNL